MIIRQISILIGKHTNNKNLKKILYAKKIRKNKNTKSLLKNEKYTNRKYEFYTSKCNTFNVDIYFFV